MRNNESVDREASAHQRCVHGRTKHHHHTHSSRSQHAQGHHLLCVEDLSVSFRMYETDCGFFQAEQRQSCVIDRLSISVHRGEIVAIVGESGSGKTLVADSIMGLFEPNATVTGRIWFDGDLCDSSALARLRGDGISYVPQSASCLDPLMRVVNQVAGFGSLGESKACRRRKALELLESFGLDARAARCYPHELSGGMARRVLLCCALMDNPRLIIADEPTPGLDLDQAIHALDDLRRFADEGGGVMLITHDIELALRVADRIAVFKDGTVIEETPVSSFSDPSLLEHPFSKALWHALPEHDFSGGVDA